MLLSLFSLFGLAVAYTDSEPRALDTHTQIHARREYLHSQLTPPPHPLIWGDFNVIHTTDTHGWLLGHQKPVWPEPNYSGDLGDFASFVKHMKKIAFDNDVHLLLVDSGDVHDGTGLSDGYPPGGVDAHDSNKFLLRLPYDLMTIGNHELYVYADTLDMYTNFVPQLPVKGRYLTSNVNINITNHTTGELVSVPVGNRSVTFTSTTRSGKQCNVTSLGVHFKFKGNSNTTVQNVTDMVGEKWFADAIEKEPDVFVLLGHMPVSDQDWLVVVKAIQRVHKYTPIMIFGGHSHIRDCKQYSDGRTIALQSGRYMETIGWMSAELDAAKGNTNNITFTRRYLDQNRITYQNHTNKTDDTFDTPEGLNITRGLQELAAKFNLSYVYGKAPKTYTLNRYPYKPTNDDALALFVTRAAPAALAINNTRASIPNVVIVNNGLVRYGIFEGNFTKNDQLTVVPYAEPFSYIPNVTLATAIKVLPELNKKPTGKVCISKPRDHGLAETAYRKWSEDTDEPHMQATFASGLTPGYVTKDECPGLGPGDDIPHEGFPCYENPHYVSSIPPKVANDTLIDLVFLTRMKKDMLGALEKVTGHAPANVSSYSPILSNEVLGLYAQAGWPEH